MMNKSELSGIALRKYAQMGFWHNEFVKRVIMQTDYSNILNYNLQNEDSIKNDIALLKQLAKDYGGLFVDLWTDKELQNYHEFLTDSEYERLQQRLFPDDMIQELLDLVNAAKAQCAAGHVPPKPSGDISDLMQLCEVIRVRKALDNYEFKPARSEPAVPSEAACDVETSPQPDKLPAISVRKPKRHGINVTNTKMRYTRAYTNYDGT